MTSRSSYRSETQHQRAVVARLERLTARLETAEDRQQQLERTVAALAREAGLSIGYPCTQCNRCYTLVKSGYAYCPECGYRRSL
jgi:hypothetical protein